MNTVPIAHYHLPGLFEFYDLYKEFLPLFFKHREYFYDWCDIGSLYGAPAACLWGGGRTGFGDANPKDVFALLREFGISSRLTFSNSLLRDEHLSDFSCNRLCEMLEAEKDVKNGVIIYSDILLEYIKKIYPSLYFVSSTTKVITDFESLRDELLRDDFSYVVPDFRLNKNIEKLQSLPVEYKNKVEFLCNECCPARCKDRKACYESVSKKALGVDCDFQCRAEDASLGYRFSKAMESPSFVGVNDIKNVYLPKGFTNFKLEGRSLGSAVVFEMLLYYLAKPEYQLKIREEIYLDSSLDLF